MKKLLLAVLVGVFGLGMTNVFAQTAIQTRPETDQEKIIRLTAENAALKNALVNAQSQAQGNAPQAASTNTLKPYYANMEIQQLCERFDAIEGLGRDRNSSIDAYMKEKYMRSHKQVVKAEMNTSYTTSGVFDGSRPRTVYTITLTIMNRKGNTARIKTYEKWIYNN